VSIATRTMPNLADPLAAYPKGAGRVGAVHASVESGQEIVVAHRS
jgi:hypothetical protein